MVSLSSSLFPGAALLTFYTPLKPECLSLPHPQTSSVDLPFSQSKINHQNSILSPCVLTGPRLPLSSCYGGRAGPPSGVVCSASHPCFPPSSDISTPSIIPTVSCKVNISLSPGTFALIFKHALVSLGIIFQPSTGLSSPRSNFFKNKLYLHSFSPPSQLLLTL